MKRVPNPSRLTKVISPFIASYCGGSLSYTVLLVRYSYHLQLLTSYNGINLIYIFLNVRRF